MWVTFSVPDESRRKRNTMKLFAHGQSHYSNSSNRKRDLDEGQHFPHVLIPIHCICGGMASKLKVQTPFSHSLPGTTNTTIAQYHIWNPSSYNCNCDTLPVSVTHATNPISLCWNVGDVSVPSLVHSVPSPAAELHTGGQEGKEPDHSTAGVPVLRVWLLWLHTSSGSCS